MDFLHRSCYTFGLHFVTLLYYRKQVLDVILSVN
jgi:hypothetical protein